MWLWHCAEEFEHKNTAFDVYAALGGSCEWRIKWFRRISLIFLSDTLRQAVNNLSPDGRLWQWPHLEKRGELSARPAWPDPPDLPALARLPAQRLSPEPAVQQPVGPVDCRTTAKPTPP